MFRTILIFGLLVAASHCMGQESTRAVNDEPAIRNCIESYVDAFNRGDGAALAAMWSEEGVWISPEGERLTGRAAIEASMNRYFAESQGQTLSVSNTTIRFLAPTVAVEEGSARVSQQGEAPSESTYIAIHVKHDGEWKLDSVRETAVPVVASNYEHLKPLEWLIGTWIDEGDESVLETTCAWTKNKNFMTRSFRVRIKDRIELEGTQVIGYDGVSDQIRSWVFDTDGGIAEGTWEFDGERWIVKNSHHLASGQSGSAVTIITPIDDDKHLLQMTGREMDGEILPDIEPVTVIRK